jgi:hypothetical protein
MEVTMNTPLEIFTARARMTSILVLALATVPAITAPASAAPVGFQATGGYYTQNDDVFLGAGARLKLATVTLIPNAEWLFESNANVYTLNIDGTLNVLPMAVATGYVGGGLGFFTSKPDHGSSNTDTVFNLIAGAGLNQLPLKPFAQLKWLMGTGNNPVAFTIGARF